MWRRILPKFGIIAEYHGWLARQYRIILEIGTFLSNNPSKKKEYAFGFTFFGFFFPFLIGGMVVEAFLSPELLPRFGFAAALPFYLVSFSYCIWLATRVLQIAREPERYRDALLRKALIHLEIQARLREENLLKRGIIPAVPVYVRAVSFSISSVAETYLEREVKTLGRIRQAKMLDDAEYVAHDAQLKRAGELAAWRKPRRINPENTAEDHRS